MSNKKRVKGVYCHTSTHDKLSRAKALNLVKNICIAQAPEKKCNIYNPDTGEPVTTNLHQRLRALVDYPHDWSITLITCGRFNGERTTKVLDLDPLKGIKCKADEIQDSVKEAHDKQMRGYNQRQFLAGVWIATPQENSELSESTIDAILDDLGVWDNYITQNENMEK